MEFYDNCNKVSYLQKNKKSYNWETTSPIEESFS